MATKKTKTETSKIDEKIIKAFLLSHKEENDAKQKKAKAAEALIAEMEKLGMKKLSCLDKNISLCQKDTLVYNETIAIFEETIKKAKELSKIKGETSVANTSFYLYVTDKKEDGK